MSKIATKWIADNAVTEDKINTSAVGDGLSGGGGSALAVAADSTGGANLATVVNVSANGVAVKINDTTIGENGSNQLEVKSNSIGPTQIDETAAYTWGTGSHDFTGCTSVSVPTPTGDSHACTKGYADGLRQGISYKEPCRAMNDSNESLTGDPGTVDGVSSWTTGDRMLLTNQTSPDENGIWEVNTGGAWNRPADFDTGDHASGATTWIDQGTSYGESQWTCTTNAPNDVIDTNDLAFVQTSGAGQITAGTGLQKSGNTINVGDGSTGNIGGIARTADDISAAVDNSTIEVSSNVLQVKDLGITGGKLANATVTETQLNASVAGDGITGGAGTSLAVNPNDVGTAETSADNADLIIIYDDSATAVRKMTRGNFLSGVGGGTTPVVDFHKITSGETTAGYFTLSQNPASATRVSAHVVGGPDQINKQIVGATGATPDYDILSTNQFHFNNNGAATGLSADLTTDDIVEVRYDY